MVSFMIFVKTKPVPLAVSLLLGQNFIIILTFLYPGPPQVTQYSIVNWERAFEKVKVYRKLQSTKAG